MLVVLNYSSVLDQMKLKDASTGVVIRVCLQRRRLLWTPSEVCLQCVCLKRAADFWPAFSLMGQSVVEEDDQNDVLSLTHACLTCLLFWPATAVRSSSINVHTMYVLL